MLKEPPLHFPNLDALRFFAFFAVFLAHAFREIARERNAGTLGVFGNLAFNLGSEGVGLFFVLSGFLITYLLLIEDERHGHINIKAFYIRRVLRIWPLYYLTLVVAFWLYPAWSEWSGGRQISNPAVAPYAFFLSNFAHILEASQNQYRLHLDLTWSIAVEEQFYLLWPLILRFTPSRVLPLLFPAGISASFLFRALERRQPHVGDYHSLSVASDLMVGGGLAYLVVRVPLALSAIKGLGRRYIVAGYGAGFFMLLFRDFVYLDTFWPGAPRSLQVFLVIGKRLFLSIFYAFILAEQCFSEASFFKLGKLSTISKLGTYTFGLYLLHPYALIMLDEATSRLGRANDPSIRLIWKACALPLSIAMAMVSYHLIERPFLGLKRRYEVVQTRA